MLGNVSTVLQSLATALTTGTFALAVATLGIAGVGILWILGRISIMAAVSVVLGIAILGAASTIAQQLVTG